MASEITGNHTSSTHFNDAKKPKIPNFVAAKHIEIARFLEVPKSKYVHCYLIFMFPSFTDQKVALTMLTYHDCSRSFSDHAICNYDVLRNIELQGVTTVILALERHFLQKLYNEDSK